MNSTPQILDPCCGGKMLWFNKNDRRAAFCDRRREKHILCDGRFFEVNPDTVCDFRKLPFTDESFFLKEYADTIAMAEAMGGTGLAFSASNRTRSWAACLSMSHTAPSPSSQMMYVFSTSPAMRQGASSRAGASGSWMVCCAGSGSGTGSGVGAGGVI